MADGEAVKDGDATKELAEQRVIDEERREKGEEIRKMREEGREEIAARMELTVEEHTYQHVCCAWPGPPL